MYHSEDEDESNRREAFVRSQLGIPEAYRVVAILGLGYPDVEPSSKAMIPMERVFHKEKFMDHR